MLRLVKSLGSAAITVLGNHDLHLLAAALTPSEQLKPQDTLGEIFAAPDRDELLDWLRSLPLLHHDATLGYTMIHAGLPPQWDLATAQSCARELEQALRDDERCLELFTHMYGDQPNRWSDDLRGVDRLRFITNCLTRLRFCRADGTLELKFKGKIESAPHGVMPWFRVPQRRSRDLRIVCGHWSALGYHDGDGVLSIDTGCVWGEKLCAVRLDRSAPRRSSSRAARPGSVRTASSDSLRPSSVGFGSSGFGSATSASTSQLRLPERQLLRRAVRVVLDDAHRELRQHFAAQLVDQLAVAGLQVDCAAAQRHALPLRRKRRERFADLRSRRAPAPRARACSCSCRAPRSPPAWLRPAR